MTQAAQRVMIATQRDDLQTTVVLRDELPALEEDEIRLRVDKVGLSANNLFYAQMGEAPFLKFFAVYPLAEAFSHLANLPAWGIATVIESANPAFSIGERFRGFLHMTNVVQMKARRIPDGYVAYGQKRDKLNQAYNGFKLVEDSKQADESGASVLGGAGQTSDLAMTCSPGASSGFLLTELLRSRDFYAGNSVVISSASSKLSLATAQQLGSERKTGRLERVIGFTSMSNAEFVRSTNVYDEVLTYDQTLPVDGALKHVFIDVAGDAELYKRIKGQLVKGLAVGGTHADAKTSTFTAFGPSGFLKMFIDMVAPAPVKNWASKKLNPPLEMFFAPTVINELLLRWGDEEVTQRTDVALRQFVDAAIDEGWMTVTRCEDLDAIQTAYKKILSGQLPPSEAVIVSLEQCV